MSWDRGVSWYTDLSSPPSGDVVNLAYMRDLHLRAVNDSNEDPKIQRALDSATAQAEHFMGRAILDQTWLLVLSGFPASGQITLPYPPLVSVTSIAYTDENGDAQTLATSEYDVRRLRGPNAGRSWIDRAYNVTWPATRVQRDAVTVTFRAGYIDTDVSPEVENIPEAIREGIAMRAAELYKQRSDSIIGVGITSSPAMVASRNLWHDYKVYG